MGNDQLDLSEKVGIVVGGTKGMGAAIAEQFAASGARVTVNSRTAAEAEAFAGRLNDSHGRGEPVARAAPGDMTDKAVFQEVVDSTVATFGKLTTLVLSASIRPWFGPSIAMPDDEVDTHFLSMFKCRFWMTALCIPHMVGAGEGSVVYIGSGSPFEATSERSVASCMRAAEIQMMKNFAAELGTDNVRFNIIAPGPDRRPRPEGALRRPGHGRVYRGRAADEAQRGGIRDRGRGDLSRQRCQLLHHGGRAAGGWRSPDPRRAQSSRPSLRCRAGRAPGDR
jgi:NAD(P)-dependent dehydrogenase (short-subunit alcohol dehydrogenase family)